MQRLCAAGFIVNYLGTSILALGPSVQRLLDHTTVSAITHGPASRRAR